MCHEYYPGIFIFVFDLFLLKITGINFFLENTKMRWFTTVLKFKGGASISLQL